jgi:2-aminobenzoate-CoA ligase
MKYTAHQDTFARDHLPPPEDWPELVFDLPELQFPERLNCAAEILDGAVARGWGNRPAIYAPVYGGRCVITYRELLASANQIAHVLTDDLGLVPGERVLLCSPNNPAAAACWFAVLKAGGIAVTAMPQLRSKELTQIMEKTRSALVLCDARFGEQVRIAASLHSGLRHVIYFNWAGTESLEARLEGKPADFDNVETAADDVAIIAFTSGTSGQPKAAMHFHRDILAAGICYARGIITPSEGDIFCGTAPLGFTFGLLQLVSIPLQFGAASVLVEKRSPAGLLQTIQDFRGTVCGAVPTVYRQMAAIAGQYDLSSLKVAISSGERLSDETRRAFRNATGHELIDGLGSTELILIVISHTPERVRYGATGYVMPGCRAAIVDEHGQPCPAGTVGQLAVKGPNGCLYLDDPRQKQYVKGGWNLTGDAFSMDDDGYFYSHGRIDDLIISGGNNISASEVETTLIEHESIAECAVVGVADQDRGQVVKAFVVLKPGFAADAQTRKVLQDFAKSKIAPYKYPRHIEFVPALPRTQTGKVQRFSLRVQGQSPSK